MICIPIMLCCGVARKVVMLFFARGENDIGCPHGVKQCGLSRLLVGLLVLVLLLWMMMK